MITFRLSLMMFLHYAVWGAWLPVAASYLNAPTWEGGLGFSWPQIGMILGLGGSVGAIIAPFIGQFADRYFRTEHVLAVLLTLGGIIKWYTASQTGYTEWVVLSIVYSILFMPTLALSNSLAMAHMSDRQKQFPLVRVWGTIGWIAASWAFAWVWLQQDLKLTWLPPFLVGDDVDGVVSKLVDALRLSGILAFIYAAYCLTLPATPPKRDAIEKFAIGKALRLLGKPSFLLVFLISLPIAAVHQIYFIQTPVFLPSVGLQTSSIGPAMSVGQFAEIGVMAVLGFMLKGLGFRRVLFLGALAYFGRYMIWGMADLPLWIYVSSQVLHGFCYGCFFAAAYIYVDLMAPSDVRHSAQTIFGILILGLGPILGGQMIGPLAGAMTDSTSFAKTIAAVDELSGAQNAILLETKDLEAGDPALPALAERQRAEVAAKLNALTDGFTADKEALAADSARTAELVDLTAAVANASAAVEEASALAEAAMLGEDLAGTRDQCQAAIGALGNLRGQLAPLDWHGFWRVLAYIGLIAALLLLLLFRDETVKDGEPAGGDSPAAAAEGAA